MIKNGAVKMATVPRKATSNEKDSNEPGVGIFAKLREAFLRAMPGVLPSVPVQIPVDYDTIIVKFEKPARVRHIVALSPEHIKLAVHLYREAISVSKLVLSIRDTVPLEAQLYYGNKMLHIISDDGSLILASSSARSS